MADEIKKIVSEAQFERFKDEAISFAQDDPPKAMVYAQLAQAQAIQNLADVISSMGVSLPLGERFPNQE